MVMRRTLNTASENEAKARKLHGDEYVNRFIESGGAFSNTYSVRKTMFDRREIEDGMSAFNKWKTTGSKKSDFRKSEFVNVSSGENDAGHGAVSLADGKESTFSGRRRLLFGNSATLFGN